LIDESSRTEQADLLLAPDVEAQQPVEADEVVDMRVRDEHLLEPQDLSCRQRRDVAEIDEDRALLEQRLDVERRIARAAVDQGGMQQRTHARVLARFRPGSNAPAPCGTGLGLASWPLSARLAAMEATMASTATVQSAQASAYASADDVKRILGNIDTPKLLE